MEKQCPPQMEPSWFEALQDEFQKPYMQALRAFVAQERSKPIPVYPPAKDVFNAFAYTPIEHVKVVIVGQDPYHGHGQAHGLCFSVQQGVKPPPSLQNIFKELQTDLGMKIPSHGCLTTWAKQGVLLLNATLTVAQASPMSHQKKGWEEFTDAVIKKLSECSQPIVYLLWGRHAQNKCQYPLPQHQLILKAPHPSPFSAHQGFLGSGHFSKANQFLTSYGQKPIDWSLE